MTVREKERMSNIREDLKKKKRRIIITTEKIKFLAQPLSETTFLPTRIYTILSDAENYIWPLGTKTRVKYVYEFVQLSRQQVLSVNGIGFKLLDDIEEALRNLSWGLYLGVSFLDAVLTKIEEEIIKEATLIKKVKPLKDRFYKALVVSQYIDGEWVELITVKTTDEYTDTIVANAIANDDSTCLLVGDKESVIVVKANGPIKIKQVSKIRPKD